MRETQMDAIEEKYEQIYYCGIRLDKLSKEELMDIIIHQHDKYQKCLQESTKERDFFANLNPPRKKFLGIF